MLHYLKQNKNQQRRFKRLLVVIAASFLVMPTFLIHAQEQTETNVNAGETTAEEQLTTDTAEAPVTVLNDQIDEKRKTLDELQKKAEIYQQNIKVKQQETVTLANQISLLDLQVQQSENDIETVRTEIDSLNLELTSLDTEITQKTAELDDRKKVLADYLRLIYRYDQQTYLEIFMSNQSFSDFFDNLQYAQNLQGSVEDALKAAKAVKTELESEQRTKQAKKDELTSLSEKLTTSIIQLSDQKLYKTTLISETKESEVKFTELLEQAKREQDAAQSEISTLEQKAREKLEQGGVDLDTSTVLMWPVAATKGISAYFRDPTYPFRKYFEHPAIDIPQPQGTPIRAADNGYVARAKNGGLGYSYIMIIHNNQLSTVYGHVSRIDVAEDQYVVRGQQIGLVGGLPGTPGAGGFTTGPHLHFEVRYNGIPVNPLDYLPAM